MGKRPLRIQCIDDVFLVSNRCFQNKPLLPTDPISTSRLAGALGRCASNYGIELYAYTFLPHGFWMVLHASKANRQNFMRDFESWVARWCNTSSLREGDFFHDRYDDEAIADTGALVDTLIDVLVAPVREGFVEDLDDYTGLTSWPAVKSGRPRLGEWIDRERLYSLRRSNPDLPDRATAREVRVELADLPLDRADATRWLVGQVDTRAAAILAWQREQEADGEHWRRERPHPRPRRASPLEPLGPPKYHYGITCRAAHRDAHDRRRQMRREVREVYSTAMGLWRKGKDEWCSNGVCEVKRRRQVLRDYGRLVEVTGAVDVDVVAQRSAGGEASRGESNCERGGIAQDGGGEERLQNRAELSGGSVADRKRGEPRPEEEIDFPTSTIPPGWLRTRRPLRQRPSAPPDPLRNAP